MDRLLETNTDTRQSQVSASQPQHCGREFETPMDAISTPIRAWSFGDQAIFPLESSLVDLPSKLDKTGGQRDAELPKDRTESTSNAVAKGRSKHFETSPQRSTSKSLGGHVEEDRLKSKRRSSDMLTKQNDINYDGLLVDTSLGEEVEGLMFQALGGSWKDGSGLLIQRRSRMEEEDFEGQGGQVFYGTNVTKIGSTQVSLERSASVDSTGGRIRMGLRIPRTNCRLESTQGGILRVRPGDADIDNQLGISSQLSQSSPTSMQAAAGSRRPGSQRWVEKLESGAIVLQCAIRCHHARRGHSKLVRLLETDAALQHRMKESLMSLAVIGMLGKMKRKTTLHRNKRDSAQQKAAAIDTMKQMIPNLRSAALHDNLLGFLNIVDLHEKTFESMSSHLSLEECQIFRQAVIIANAHSEDLATCSDDDLIWTPVNPLPNPLAWTSGPYIKTYGHTRIIKARDGEDAAKLARALALFLDKLNNSAFMPHDKQKMPPLAMAANWLRLNKYHVAHALKRYNKLLEFSTEWTSDLPCVNLWYPLSLDMAELQGRGLRLLRGADGRVLEDKDGGVVVRVDAHDVYIKGKHSIGGTQALLVLFWRSIVIDCPAALQSGITGVLRQVWCA